MKTIIKTILVLGLAGPATWAFADNGMTPTNQGGAFMSPQFLQGTTQGFVLDAMTGGMKEVRLGEIALQKTQNADVKNFAEHMVRDHAKANEKLMKIAIDEGLSTPATNTFSADDPNWNYPLLSNPAGLKGGQMLTLTNLPYLGDYQAIQRLQSLSGDQFDQAYSAEMVNDHTNAINEFYAVSQSLTDNKLIKFANKTLPTLRKHYDMAKEMADKWGAMVNTNSADANPSFTVPVL
jgi:putative membrane protein